MRVIVCEDNEIICKAYCTLIREFFEKETEEEAEVVGYLTGEEVLADTGDKDIVFMDVELPGINGIEVSCKLKEQNPKTIIFIVTGHEQYNDDAFRVHAFRFILKEFRIERMYRNLKEAIQYYYTACGKINLTDKNEVHSEYKSDIIFVEAREHGVLVHTTTGWQHRVTTSMKEMQEELKEGCFFQSHRGYVVNMHYISKYNKKEIHFENCEAVALIARMNYKKFVKKYDAFLKIMNAEQSY